jgi:hypothetical protein
LNPTLQERLKSTGRILVYIVLVIFLVRNVLDVVKQVTGADAPVAPKQTVTSNEVPVTAKSVAKLFLENWYTVGTGQKDEDRIKRLEPLMTVSMLDYINSVSDLSIDNAVGPNQSATNTTTSNSNAQNTTEFKGVSAKEVEVWQATWTDQKAGKAKIVARMLTSEDKTLFLSIPVVKSGSTWQVSSLPALVAEPQGSDKPDEIPSIDITNEEEAIKKVLDSFFQDWLGGNSEAISRYMVDRKAIPTTNWLEELGATYEKVQTITPLSENPLKVKVVIMIKDSNNVKMLLDYYMTLEQKNGSWNIVSID